MLKRQTKKTTAPEAQWGSCPMEYSPVCSPATPFCGMMSANMKRVPEEAAPPGPHLYLTLSPLSLSTFSPLHPFNTSQSKHPIHLFSPSSSLRRFTTPSFLRLFSSPPTLHLFASSPHRISTSSPLLQLFAASLLFPPLPSLLHHLSVSSSS